jgi:hypothetical protein
MPQAAIELDVKCVFLDDDVEVLGAIRQPTDLACSLWQPVPATQRRVSQLEW